MKLWSIAPENDFLAVLAKAITDGTLPGEEHRFSLNAWTILVPTRRAARALSAMFLEQSGRRAILLPRIRPIGDIDEETLADSVALDDVPPAISKAGLTHLLVDLVLDWAARNPQLTLAGDVERSPQQALQLALSLQELLDQVETEESDFSNLPQAYDLDLAGHRSAILDLIDVVARDLPLRLRERGLATPSRRRNQLLRLEAARIAGGEEKGPMVAAGSTGTNPAARELLRAIALKEHGAVVLPGLDISLDEQAWAAIDPQHPQHAMKEMLESWRVERKAVRVLGAATGPRLPLLSDMMLPAAATDGWQARNTAPPSLQGLELVEAHDRHEEALVIALRFKKFLALEQGTAALITPDRDLAQRVMTALRRWDIAIDDSSGTPLSRQPLGALAVLLLKARFSDYAPAEFLALLHHPLANFGVERGRAVLLKEMLEACCFRGLPGAGGLTSLSARIDTARQRAAHHHAHPMQKRVQASDWTELEAFVARIVAVLGAANDTPRSFAGHAEALRVMLSGITGGADDAGGDEGGNVALLFEALEEEQGWTRPIGFAAFAPVLLHHLATLPVRPPLASASRISILGLPEARLIPLDLAILGGLNDGAWPRLSDTGPWLNRAMRATLSLSPPERDTGITAHDFVQGLGRREVMVTWSRRMEGKPVLPSRWILRLRAVLELQGIAASQHLAGELGRIARHIDQPGPFAPWNRPAVRPPVALRPTEFSVTEIERLVRDSYAVFARRVLELEPLDEADEELDAALRGNLVHEAIGRWLLDPYQGDPDRDLAQLLQRGEEAFAGYLVMPEVARLWWPRFAHMAKRLVEIEAGLRDGFAGLRVETGGRISFDAGGSGHALKAQADRIDIRDDGSLHIIDYKTGKLPTAQQVESGFSPQLTLEAAIAARNGFKDIVGHTVSELSYVQVGGGREPASLVSLSQDLDVRDTAEKHFAALQQLLAKFRESGTAYVPRHNLFKEEERSNFDHLSRRGEWELAQREET